MFFFECRLIHLLLILELLMHLFHLLIHLLQVRRVTSILSFLLTCLKLNAVVLFLSLSSKTFISSDFQTSETSFIELPNSSHILINSLSFPVDSITPLAVVSFIQTRDTFSDTNSWGNQDAYNETCL